MPGAVQARHAMRQAAAATHAARIRRAQGAPRMPRRRASRTVHATLRLDAPICTQSESRKTGASMRPAACRPISAVSPAKKASVPATEMPIFGSVANAPMAAAPAEASAATQATIASRRSVAVGRTDRV